MVSRRLIEYVREDLKKYSEKEIRKILIEQGYPEELADNAIMAAVEVSEQEKEAKGEKEEKGIKELEEEKKSRKEQLKVKSEQTKKKLGELKKKTTEKARKNSKVLIPISIIIILVMSFFVFNDFFTNLFYGITTKNTRDDPCEGIDSKEKDDCYKDIALERQNVNLCYKIEDNDLKNHCIGVINLNSSFCELIEENKKKGLCYMNIAINKREIDLCHKIGGNDLKNYCIGLINLNSSFCELIEEEKTKDWCYVDITLGTEDVLGIGNEELCYKVENSSRRLACVGIITINSSLCELIEGEKAKDWCYKEILERKPY